MATAAPDKVKRDVIYLGIMTWDTDNWKDLEFMMNKKLLWTFSNPEAKRAPWL